MKFSAPLCLLTLILCCWLNLSIAAQEADRSQFALEFPELSTGQMTEPKNYVARTDVNTIKFWILNPAADTIDWGKIKVRVNRQSANIVCSQNAATLGKVLKCDLNRIAGFRLHPKDNLFEIEAVSRDGKPFYVSYRVFTDASAAGKMSFSGRKFAVVIGVSEYKYKDIGLGNLDFPDDDADAFYAWLKQTGGFAPDNILYMTNENATLDAVRRSLNGFLTKATENDLVFFFLAGHGTPDPFNPRELYYLVYDSKIADLKNTGFPMTELKQIVDTKLKSKRSVFLLDTCHSAGLSGKKVVVPPREVKLNNTSQKGGRDVTAGNDFNERQLLRVEIKNDVNETVGRLFNSPGRAVLTSSDTNETSRESERWGGGHGVFTWALLEGLRGKADANSDKKVTTDELFTFVRQKVRAETNEKQNPRLFSNLGGGLEIAVLQDETKSRSLDAEDFLKQRPADAAGTPTGIKGGKGKGAKQPPKPVQRPKYDFVRKEQKVARVKNNNSPPIAKTPPKPILPAKTSQIGVTMWRLREARSNDKEQKIQDANRRWWTPVRVGADTIFSEGDKVRIAVESSVKGYLYIVDSEILANGSYGRPRLIFPESEDEDNRVRPGLLFEIPDKSFNPPYFSITSNTKDYVGELLTVIISSSPLTNLETDADGWILKPVNLAALEENSEVEMFAKAGGAGEAYTKEEAEAACDQKTRQLERKKPQPCTNSRQLTRDEPPPQNIYRVKSIDGQPAVLFVRLDVSGK